MSIGVCPPLFRLGFKYCTNRTLLRQLATLPAFVVYRYFLEGSFVVEVEENLTVLNHESTRLEHHVDYLSYVFGLFEVQTFEV